MKRKGIILLFLIFFFMYILNVMTPLLSDDYFISFVWPEGVRINGTLPEDAKRVSSIFDVYNSLKAYYFVWGGRLPGQTLMTVFAWWGKEYFNFVNAFMSVLLIMEIYWISHEGNIAFEFDYKYIGLIFFYLWTFNLVFVDIFLWLSGSCEYLWMMVLLLAFLLPYVQNYFDETKHNSEKLIFSIGMFLGGVVTGCSREMLICWIIMALAYWLFLCKKKNRLQSWQIFGLVGLVLGYSLLILAPGNFARLVADDQAEYVFMNSELLVYKIIFALVLFCFHSFLWHFIITFFVRRKCEQSKIIERSISAYKNIGLAKISFLISLGTALFLFVLKYSGARPSFVTLVLLIISAASLIRAMEKTRIQIVSNAAKLFLKTIGTIYLVVTMLVSVFWNYENWHHWSNILQTIKKENINHSHAVLEVLPMPYPSLKNETIITINSFIGASAGIWCGAHIFDMTVLDENYSDTNKVFSRYYKIEGIKLIK